MTSTSNNSPDRLPTTINEDGDFKNQLRY